MLTVDTAHLLCNHDNARRLRGSSHPRNCKQLDESCENVGMDGDTRCSNEKLLFLHLSMDVIELSGSLKFGVSETA